MNYNQNHTAVKQIVNNKMRVLSDFGICDRHDNKMKTMLYEAIEAKPDRDPEEVLDYVCRPMVQAKANSWH